MVAVVLAALGLASAVGARNIVREWAFIEEVPLVAHVGLATPVTLAGQWEIAEHEGATGGRALLNHPGTGNLPAVAVALPVNGTATRASTRCRVLADLPARACGLVFAFRDPKNHHVARVDVAAETFVLASVVDGSERVLVEVPLSRSDPGGWFEIEVEIEAATNDVAVRLDAGRVVMSLPIAAAGRSAGLWAPAAGAAAFDRLRIDTAPGWRFAGL